MVLLGARALEEVGVGECLEAGGFPDGEAARLVGIGVDVVVPILGDVAGDRGGGLIEELHPEPVGEGDGSVRFTDVPVLGQEALWKLVDRGAAAFLCRKPRCESVPRDILGDMGAGLVVEGSPNPSSPVPLGVEYGCHVSLHEELTPVVLGNFLRRDTLGPCCLESGLPGFEPSLAFWIGRGECAPEFRESADGFINRGGIGLGQGKCLRLPIGIHKVVADPEDEDAVALLGDAMFLGPNEEGGGIPLTSRQEVSGFGRLPGKAKERIAGTREVIADAGEDPASAEAC